MTDAQDLQGRTFFITGSSAGIGRVTAETLARRGGRVILANRSEAKTKPVLDAIRAAGGDADFVQVDLGDLRSVRRCAEAFLARNEPLHVLINNAGVAGVRGVSTDGFQLTFATNHLGPFLLTNLLLPRLQAQAGSRIVNVASRAHTRVGGIYWEKLHTRESFTGFPEYAVSKLCNVLFTAELARGAAGPNVHSYALHPGVIASEVWREVPWPIRPLMMLRMKTPEQGAVASLRCATSPEVAEHDGRYYDEDGGERAPARVAQDPALAKELWERSARWVGLAG
jgi:NAD(P)-dependent dehydrogenase (short-subunit alcohol dehydrogenase family)